MTSPQPWVERCRARREKTFATHFACSAMFTFVRQIDESLAATEPYPDRYVGDRAVCDALKRILILIDGRLRSRINRGTQREMRAQAAELERMLARIEVALTADEPRPAGVE